MKKTITDFFKNVKEYVKYLMDIGFKELFANTVILLCMLIIAAFAYIPVGILEDIIRTLIQITLGLPEPVAVIYSWIFKVVGACCSIFAFMWLFNLRYNYVEKKVTDPFKGSVTKKEKDVIEEDLDMPKVKEKED